MQRLNVVSWLAQMFFKVCVKFAARLSNCQDADAFQMIPHVLFSATNKSLFPKASAKGRCFSFKLIYISFEGAYLTVGAQSRSGLRCRLPWQKTHWYLTCRGAWMAVFFVSFFFSFFLFFFLSFFLFCARRKLPGREPSPG